MTANEGDPSHARTDVFLTAYNEALAAGRSLPEPPSPEAAQGARALQLLRQVLAPGGKATSEDAGPPVRIGRFEVRREIGRGSFGVVYLAYDPTLRREVALKVPLPGTLLDPARFLREARVAARLDHPNIVAVHDAGVADGVCYIASAYCPGVTLAGWLKKAPNLIPPRDAASLGAALARAAHHAHQKGVIHRDLKPANVLLHEEESTTKHTKDTKKDRPEASKPEEAGPEDTLPSSFRVIRGSTIPKITDFGLARFCHDDGAGTLSGAILGTPNYMAPEQAAGKSKDVGPAADVYALGAILYELLTGRPPRRGEACLHTLGRAWEDPPEPPRRLRPRLDRRLENVCLKCLEKDPERRYASAEALAHDLEHFLEGKSVQAKSTPWWERPLRWARRRPTAAAVWAVSALALAGLVFGGVFWARLDQANELADVQGRLRQEAERNQMSVAESRRALAGQFTYLREILQVARYRKEGATQKAFQLIRGLRQGEDTRKVLGFEGRLLHRLTDAERVVLTLPNTDASCLAFAPDGRTLAAGGEDGALYLWDTASWQLRAWPKRHVGAVAIRALSYAPDGTLATAGDDGTIRFWEANGTLSRTLNSPGGLVLALAYHPKGNRLAIGATDGRVTIWDARTGQFGPMLPTLPGNVHCVAWSADGRTLAAGTGLLQPRDGHLGELVCWDAGTGQEKSRCGTIKPVYTVAFSPTDGWAAVGGHNSNCQIWDSGSGRGVDNLLCGPVYGVAWAPDGGTLAVCNSEGHVLLFDARGASPRAILRGHSGHGMAVAFAPCGDLLASAGKDRSIRIWNASVTQPYRALGGRRQPDGRLALSPDRKTLALADHDSTVRLLNVATRQEIGVLGRASGRVQKLVFSGDGTRLAVVANSVELWDFPQRRLVGVVNCPQSVATVALSPDGRLLMMGGSTGEVLVWDVAASKEPLRRLQVHLSGTTCLAFAPDGKTLFGASGRSIFRWDTTTWQEQLPRLEHGDDVTAFAVFPDGGHLAACIPKTNCLYRWELPARSSPSRPPEPLRVMDEFADRIKTLMISPDGAELAGIDDQNFFVLWDATSLALKSRFNDAGGGRYEGAYLAPGVLVTCHEDGSLRTFDMRGSHVRDWQVRDWEVTPPTSIEALAFSPDGKTLAASSHAWYEKVDFFREGKRHPRGEHTTAGHGPVAPPITVWDVATGQPRLALPRQDLYASRALAFHPSGSELAVGSGSPAVWRYDPANGKHLPAFPVDTRANAHWGLLDIARRMGLTPHTTYRDTPVLVAYSPDGKLLAAATDEYPGNVKIWDLQSRQEILALPNQNWSVTAVAFAPDSSALAVAIGNTVRLWGVAHSQWGRTLACGGGRVRCLAFASGGTLAAGTDGGAIVLWDPSKAEESTSWLGNSSRVNGVAFSPDGKTLATASYDGKVILWSAASGQRLLELEGHTGPVHCLAFSPDGTVLATGGKSAFGRGELFLWEAPRLR